MFDPFDGDDGFEDSWEPTGFLGATRHDMDDHSRCDPGSCPNAED